MRDLPLGIIIGPLGDNLVSIYIIKDGVEILRGELDQKQVLDLRMALGEAAHSAQYLSRDLGKCGNCGKETRCIEKGKPGNYECATCTGILTK